MPLSGHIKLNLASALIRWPTSQLRGSIFHIRLSNVLVNYHSNTTPGTKPHVMIYGQHRAYCNNLIGAIPPSASSFTAVSTDALISCISTNLPQLASTTPVVISHNYKPPAAIANTSCVYLLLIQQEIGIPCYLYIGESESIIKRLARHRYSIVCYVELRIIMYALGGTSSVTQ